MAKQNETVAALVEYVRAVQLGRETLAFEAHADKEDGFPYGVASLQRCVVDSADIYKVVNTIGKTVFRFRCNTPEFGNGVVAQVVRIDDKGNDAPTWFDPSEVVGLRKAVVDLMAEASEGGYEIVNARDAAAKAVKDAAYDKLSPADKAAADKAKKAKK